MSIADMIRGGKYTPYPSDHNRMLSTRERTPMLRWRLVAIFNLVFWLGLCAPIQILMIGLYEFPGEWWSAFKDSLRILRTGHLHG